MRLAHETGAEAARARASALTAPSPPVSPGPSVPAAAPAPPVAPLTPVPLAEAFGLPLAADLRALFDVPHYDSSAMDGYAVAGPPPWLLDDPPDDEDEAESAGRAAPPPLRSGRARTVVTGGPVPAGASGVVRSEYTVGDGRRIALHPGSPAAELEPGRHVRSAGREAAAGDVLAPAGRPLTPPLLAMAGIAGHDEVPVLPPVTAALLLTGDEVRTSGTPAAGEVRDAFEVQLPHVLRAAGVEVAAVRRIGDDRAVTREAVAELVELADVVVITGGTGRSRADHVRAELMEQAAGAHEAGTSAHQAGSRANDGGSRPTGRIVIDELGMRPGHPTMLALLGRGEQAGAGRPVPVLALPGNPLAAMAAMRIVGSGLLRGLRGAAPEVPLTVPAAEDLPAERAERLVPAHPADPRASAPPAASAVSDVPAVPAPPGTAAPATSAPDRETAWRPVEHVASNMMRGLTAAQGWLVLPTRPVRSGERLPFLPLEW